MLGMLRMPVAYRVFFWQATEHRLRSLRWHEQIADAFARHDPAEVRRLMEGHLLEARDFLIAIKEQHG
jgi:DNA-binding GntR family transcriptional regulator